MKKKKILKQIEEELKKLEKEKAELLFIKDQLDGLTPTIDISDVYVWKNNDLYSIVKYEKNSEKMNSLLIDVFSKDIIYQMDFDNQIKREYYINDDNQKGHYAFLLPLYEYDKNFLIIKTKVPMYVLNKIYYELNNIDTSKYIKEKKKNK